MTLDDRIAEIAREGHRTNARVVVNDIVAKVAQGTGIRQTSIMGYTRAKPVVQARHLVMYEARECGLTYSAIGAAMGRDHTSIIHGVRCEAARRGLPYKQRSPKGAGPRRPLGVTLTDEQAVDYDNLVERKKFTKAEALSLIGVTA